MQMRQEGAIKPFKKLGRVCVPRALTANLDGLFRAHPPRRGDVRQFDIAPREEEAWRRLLDAEKSAFLLHTLTQVGVRQRIEREDALLLFRTVGLHSDAATVAEHGIPVAFFHIVLRGTGTFRMPDLSSTAERELKLERGVVFYMDPTLRHEITGAGWRGIACLTAVVPRRVMELATQKRTIQP